MITIKKRYKKVKQINNEKGELQMVICGQLFEFVATWKGNLYRGLFLHCNDKSTAREELRNIFRLNELDKLESLVKI